MPNSPATAWSILANHDDRIIPYYRKLAAAVHEHGAKIMTQLTHLGRRGASDAEQWLPLVAPSQLPEPYHREIPHTLEEHQIRAIIHAFGQAGATLPSRRTGRRRAFGGTQPSH